jgi:prepilin-type N-terminal cleavage/methylation domain-containing protein
MTKKAGLFGPLPRAAAAAQPYPGLSSGALTGLGNRNRIRAFTLIEIMVVVAIMGIILAAGIPSLYGFFHKSGIRKTITDVQDTCRSARQKAIISGNPADLVIHPKEGTMEVAGGADTGYSGWAKSAKIEGTTLRALKINNSHEDLSQAEEVHVRFYPNGTCDEMIMIFMSDNNQMKGISLEITTALPYIMTDQDIRGLTR